MERHKLEIVWKLHNMSTSLSFCESYETERATSSVAYTNAKIAQQREKVGRPGLFITRCDSATGQSEIVAIQTNARAFYCMLNDTSDTINLC